jgi:hypothetical protein
MSVSEVSLLAIAIANAAIAVVCVVVATRLLPLLRQSALALRRSRRTLRRLGRVSRELEYIAHDARLLEGRVSRSAHGVLDQVEPILGAVRGLVAGTRTGLGSLLSGNGDKPGRGRGRLERERSKA